MTIALSKVRNTKSLVTFGFIDDRKSFSLIDAQKSSSLIDGRKSFGARKDTIKLKKQVMAICVYLLLEQLYG